jgi:signal transduction histidine kinase
LIADNQDTLWLYTQCGLVGIPNAELQNWWKDSNSTPRLYTVGAPDGAQPAWVPFEGATKSPDGQLWFANYSGLQTIDPAKIRGNPIPPPVHVQNVIADHAACIVWALLVVWTIYRVRMRQVAQTIGARFDERLAERTRIARDLHDTLLQTIQGSKLVADDALEPPSEPARMRKALEQLSQWLQQAGQEDRAALNSLRLSASSTNDLAEAFKRAIETTHLHSMAAAISVSGDVRKIHPIVRDEVYRIGYEAIRNAHTHSRGTHLDVQLRYTDDLTLRITDNGLGATASTFSDHKEGHFGLKGMRERATRIGGRLTIMGSKGCGTEVCLVVPDSIAFQDPTESRRSRLGTLLTGNRN